MVGGNWYPDGKSLKSTETFDPTLELWAYKADSNDNGGKGVEECSGAVVNGKFYVIGGYGGGDSPEDFNLVEEYNPATNAWISKAPMPPRSVPTPVAYNDKTCVFWGNAEDAPTDVVEVYDPANDSWETVTYMPKTLMGFVATGSAVAVVADKAYVIGGASKSEGQMVSDVSPITSYVVTGKELRHLAPRAP